MEARSSCGQFNAALVWGTHIDFLLLAVPLARVATLHIEHATSARAWQDRHKISTQDRTHANEPRNEHTNADTKAHTKAHTSTDQPTNQPHTQPTNPPRHSLTHSHTHNYTINGNQWNFNGKTGIQKKAGISTCFTTNWRLMEINGISMEKQEFKKGEHFHLF